MHKQKGGAKSSKTLKAQEGEGQLSDRGRICLPSSDVGMLSTKHNGTLSLGGQGEVKVNDGCPGTPSSAV